MMIMNQVGASIWVICRNHQFKGLVAFPSKTELHATSHNGIKLTVIGSGESDVLSEQVELVSAHAWLCMNTNLI